MLQELGTFVAVSVLLVILSASRDTSSECVGPWLCILEMIRDREYQIRCAISLPVACAIYLACGMIAGTLFPRRVVAKGARPPVFSLYRCDADLNWSLLGLVAGTPMIQLFHHASDKYGPASGMLLYKDPLKYGLGWALAQVPLCA